MKNTALIAALLCLGVSVKAVCQGDQPRRIAIFDIDLSEYENRGQSMLGQLLMIDLLRPNALSSIPEHLVKAYSSNPDFVVVDKIHYQLIEDERERQKSEAFIDGYVVSQGKSEGIDFLMMPRYLMVDNTISVRVYDVSSGEVFCEAETELNGNKVGPEHTSYYVSRLLDQLNSECFDMRFLVLRATASKKGKAEELLIAAGKKHQIKEGRIMEIFELTEEHVGDAVLIRPNVVGECEISNVESADFSIGEVSEGHREIEALLIAGTQLYCRTKRLD